MGEEKRNPETEALDDELLAQVSGGTGADEEEEDDGITVPTYEELCATKPSITCKSCGMQILLEGNLYAICPKCGRRH